MLMTTTTMMVCCMANLALDDDEQLASLIHLKAKRDSPHDAQRKISSRGISLSVKQSHLHNDNRKCNCT